MSITVRPAESSDIPWLIEQLRQFAQFFGTKKSLFGNTSHAEATLQRLIESQPFFVADRGDAGENTERLGFIAGSLFPHPWNPDIRMLTETFWWVAPAARGTKAGLFLLDRFLDVGHEHADWIHFTLEAQSPVNPRTLERRGFALHERAYLLEVSR